MATLTGTTPANTYGGLLQVPNSNLGLDDTLRTVQDGLGSNSVLQLSNAAVAITSLTSGRVPIASTGGQIIDNAKFLYIGSALRLGWTGSATIGTVGSTESIHIGDINGSGSSGQSSIVIAKTISDATGTGDAHGFSDASALSRSGGIGYNSYDARINISSSVTYNHYAGFQMAPNVNNATNPVQLMYGLYSSPNCGGGAVVGDYYAVYAGYNNAATSTLTTFNGFFVENPPSTGTIGTAYGLRIQGLTKGTTNWAVFTGGNTSSFYGGKPVYDPTNTAAGTTGAQTINKPSGTVNFAAGASSLVVTNSLVTATSIVFAVVRTNDTTAVIKNVVPAAGSFTITLNANATAETSVGFFVMNL